jgi:hypothetical protein
MVFASVCSLLYQSAEGAQLRHHDEHAVREDGDRDVRRDAVDVLHPATASVTAHHACIASIYTAALTFRSFLVCSVGVAASMTSMTSTVSARSNKLQIESSGVMPIEGSQYAT